MKIAFYSTKDLDKRQFDAYLKEHSEVGNAIQVTYHKESLSLATVHLAAEHEGVCLFVNDDCSKEIADSLATQGVKLVLMRCAGFDKVDVDTLSKHGIAALRVPAYSPYAVAEQAVALLTCLNRNVHIAYNRVRNGDFSLDGLVGFDFHGKTVGVIGTGKIGQCFIDIMIGFGCKIICYDVFQSDVVKANPHCKYVELEELYKSSDLISIHVPLLPTTHYMINKDALSKMKRHALVVNVSRGPIVKTDDLIVAVTNGTIGGYGADVYEREADVFFKNQSDHPIQDEVLTRLLNTRNIIITPHSAFLTKDALDAITHVTLTNALEFISDKTNKKYANEITTRG